MSIIALNSVRLRKFIKLGGNWVYHVVINRALVRVRGRRENNRDIAEFNIIIVCAK